MGIMVTLAIWVVNAEPLVSEPYGHIEYTLNGNENFEAQVITVTGDDGTVITILDRNLWATGAGVGCEFDCTNEDSTYWYHFQWWNNHGFKPNFDHDDSFPWNEEKKNFDEANIDARDYWPWNYYSWSIFITDYSWNNSGDWSINRNDNLRWWSLTEATDGKGGEVDVYEESYVSWSGWKVDESTVTDRQWPCPEWFHVPSVWELAKLTKIFWVNGSVMHNQLKIPFAGARSLREANTYNFGYYTHLWSSSPASASNSTSRYITIDLEFGWANMYYEMSRAEGFSVRCFYDKYEAYPQSFTLSFTGSEWGSVSTWSIEAEEWSSITINDEIGSVQIWDIAVIATPNEWYVFSWWLTDCDGDSVATGCGFTGVFKLTTYAITYNLDWWTNSPNNVTWYTIKNTITFENPTKDWYKFDGWFSDANFSTWITAIPTWTTWDITLYAKWTKSETKPSWSSWGGSSRWWKVDIANSQTGDNKIVDSEKSNQPDKTTDDEDLNNLEVVSYNPDIPEDQQTLPDGLTPEMHRAYKFAYENKITTMSTILEADMYGPLNRISMAKMLSQYAINILWQKPDESKINKFNDVTEEMDKEYDGWVTLAYQLWIMWQNMKDNNFRPNDEVTRDELATALSRMLYSTPDGDPYYITHLQKLKAEWILKNDDINMKELRGYVMIMLMRSSK